MKWKLNKTFMGNVKGQMYVDVASEGSNKFYIFKLFHSLTEKDYPASYIQWNLSLRHLHSEDTKFGTGTMCISFTSIEGTPLFRGRKRTLFLGLETQV